ncbi:GNAT family N-acetyltransferase [Streptomyces sp. NBC_00691]|uniref:GNAT family N-acetyltransferase n=1 Tax=Streptomyces sp. NBC_00691 TaxID=2903671 RepID=UPI002E2ED330|nr:GNAT family N-acetyltransferase [Streptomyces sp. NBC_00691]
MGTERSTAERLPEEGSTAERLPAAPAVDRLEEYDRSEIFGDAVDPFGVDASGLVWLPKEHHFGIRAAGRLLAHAGLLVLPLSVGGSRFDVVGLGGVAVAPDRRGRGLAARVVAGALDHARTLGPEFALLFCRPDVSGLYARLGWSVVDGAVEVEQPDGPATMPLRTMWYPLRRGSRWPEGPVRLHSRPM